MPHRILTPTAFLCTLAFLAVTVPSFAADSTTQPASRPSTPAVGDTAPDFSLNALDGSPIRLSTLTQQGPVVLLVLRGWPGYQCPICTKQVADFMAHQKDLQSAGARILMVYPGPSDQLKDHAEEFLHGKGLPEQFYFVIDPDFTFTNAYGLRWNAPKETAYPSTFVIDSKNIIRYAHTSHTHGDRSSAPDVLKTLSTLR